MHQPHRALGEFIARGLQTELVETRIGAHERDFVPFLDGALELGGKAPEGLALLDRGTASRAAADQPLNLAPRLQQPQLLGHVDRRNQQAALRQHHDQVLARQPLNRLADRRAADTGHLAQLEFGDRRSGRKLQRDDRFLDPPIGLVRQPPPRPGPVLAAVILDMGRRPLGCRRFLDH